MKNHLRSAQGTGAGSAPNAQGSAKEGDPRGADRRSKEKGTISPHGAIDGAGRLIPPGFNQQPALTRRAFSCPAKLGFQPKARQRA